jgi:hypothetical protein
MPEWDFAITANRHCEGMLLHKVDCPQVVASRKAGDFIGTLFGCKEIPDVERCECLENVEIARSAAG